MWKFVASVASTIGKVTLQSVAWHKFGGTQLLLPAWIVHCLHGCYLKLVLFCKRGTTNRLQACAVCFS